jgi:F0F1-type ATP synthase membrane subunit b/b'
MELDKQQIVSFLQQHGQQDKVEQAEQQLPDKVDTDQHSDLLDKLGVNVQDLLGGAGGLGDKLGL